MLNEYLKQVKSYSSRYRTNEGRFAVSWSQIGHFAFNIKTIEI